MSTWQRIANYRRIDSMGFHCWRLAEKNIVCKFGLFVCVSLDCLCVSLDCLCVCLRLYVCQPRKPIVT